MTVNQFSNNLNNKVLFLVAHKWARFIKKTEGGSYSTAFRIGLDIAKYNLRNFTVFK
jgi:hypothetical protein